MKKSHFGCTEYVVRRFMKSLTISSTPSPIRSTPHTLVFSLISHSHKKMAHCLASSPLSHFSFPQHSSSIDHPTGRQGCDLSEVRARIPESLLNKAHIDTNDTPQLRSSKFTASPPEFPIQLYIRAAQSLESSPGMCGIYDVPNQSLVVCVCVYVFNVKLIKCDVFPATRDSQGHVVFDCVVKSTIAC